jgi:hypothetical protein
MVLGLALAALGLAIVGCPERERPLPPIPPIQLDLAGVTSEANYDDLSAILGKVIDADDKVDPDLLKKRAGRLDARLKRLAAAGPTATPALFPSPEDRLAYWYNARTAWSLKLWVEANCPRELTARQFEDRSFPLDGRRMTIGDIDAALSADADWRVLVSAPDIRLCGARLPRAAFTPADIRAGVAERFNEFVDDEDRFVIDVEGRRILVPSVLWRFRERLTEEYRAKSGVQDAGFGTVLLPLVSGSAHRRLQDAVGYRAVEAPPNRAVPIVK